MLFIIDKEYICSPSPNSTGTYAFVKGFSSSNAFLKRKPRRCLVKISSVAFEFPVSSDILLQLFKCSIFSKKNSPAAAFEDSEPCALCSCKRRGQAACSPTPGRERR